jgi:hypothetical protein
MKRQGSSSSSNSDSDFFRQENQAKINPESILSADTTLPWFGIPSELEAVLLQLLEPCYENGYLGGAMLMLTCSKYHAHYQPMIRGNVMGPAHREAIVGGHLQLLCWFDRYFVSPTLKVQRTCAFGEALRSHHIPVIEWAYQFIDRETWNNEPGAQQQFTTFSATLAYTGALFGLKWLDEHGFPKPTAYALDEAIAGGHCEVIQWLQERYNFIWTEERIWAGYARYRDRPHMAAMMASLKLVTPSNIKRLVTTGIFTAVSGIVHYHEEFHDLIRRLVPEQQRRFVCWPGQAPLPRSEMPRIDNEFMLFH